MNQISMYGDDILLCKPIHHLKTRMIYRETLVPSMNA